MQRHCRQEGVGQCQPVRDRFHDLLAFGHAFAIGDIVLRPHADLAQDEFELAPIEAAIRTVESGIFRCQGRQTIDGQAKPHFAGLLVKKRTRDHLAQHLLVDAKHAGLFARQLGTELLRHLHELTVIGQAIVDRGDGRLTRRNHMVGGPTKHLTRNAPDREAQHEEAKQELDQ